MTYGTLTEGQTIQGFRTEAVYFNDTDQPLGARFVHQKSGFTLDLLEIQSVPQAFVWVTTYPTSDMGEPHTQEHLLLGKGNKGRSVASHEPMSLSNSSAYTEQWRTCYHFYTSAGPDVFYDEFERRGTAVAVAAFEELAALPARCRIDDRLQGTALGVDPDGALRLRDDAGQIHRVISGEVHP